MASATEPAPAPTSASGLPKLAQLPAAERGAAKHHVFLRPAKQIHEGGDVGRFLMSQAYRDLGLFILQLNHALCPRTTAAAGSRPTPATTTLFTLQSPRADPPSVQRLRALLDALDALVDEAPPDPGPRRFGNASFRTWHRLLDERADALLRQHVVLGPAAGTPGDGDEGAEEKAEGDANADGAATAMDEVRSYFLGSFGSAQRLDYGTGHELSFLAFLGCLWKLGVFADGDAGEDGEAVERSIVLGVFEPYLRVVRKLILTYTLEPAGSHGVWGLDDHSFAPYIFGSAQLTRPIPAAAAPADNTTPMPLEGSAPRAPKPSDIVKPDTVTTQRALNLYFSAVGFINDVKKGPFWEHSPILYDVSGIQDGWGKINKGMIKMYNAEVLSKFPVVQHFPFGSLFAWDRDPDADAPAPSVHMASQPVAAAATAAATAKHAVLPPSTSHSAPGATAAPWLQATRMPGVTGLPGPGIPYSRVPVPGVATRTARPGPGPGSAAPSTTRPPPTLGLGQPLPGAGPAIAGLTPTKAPWAK